MNAGFDWALEALRRAFVARHPRSRAAVAEAGQWLPGGNTRSVLHYEPFPLVIAQGAGAEVTDLDGHRYLDCVGEFSAGLYGHSEPAIHAAIRQALEQGLVLGGPNLHEARLARALCQRFPAIERVRFCNSGTEANLLAASAARAVTGRERILVFDGAYHGGVMSFAGGGNPMNVPHAWLVAPYNDIEATRGLIREHARELAAVFIEPVLGAAGNIPGEADFLHMLRGETRDCGALLVFDEVKTSRCGAAGIQGRLRIDPDLTTLGKYLGGGLPLGGFGGRAELMARFDPRAADGLKHAGTFNNNVCSMAAGVAGLTEVYTPARAEAFWRDSEAFRQDLAARLEAAGVPLRLTGSGSMFSLHLGARAPRCAAEVSAATRRMRTLLHLYALQQGVALTARGDIFLSLPMAAAQREQLAQVLLGFVREYRTLLLSLAPPTET